MNTYFDDPEFVKKQNELKAMDDRLKGLSSSLKKTNSEFGSSDDFKMDDFKNNYESKFQPLGKSKDYKNPLTASNDKDLSGGLDYMGLSRASSAPTTGGGNNALKAAGGGSSGGAMGTIGAALGGIGDGIKANVKNPYINEGYVDEKAQKDESREQSIGAVKDTVSTAFGPWGMLFRGIEKVGNSAGEAVGGEAGAAVTASFSPDEAIMANNSDPDVKTGDKIMGMLIPQYAGVSAERAKAKRKKEFMIKQFKMEGIKREQEQRMEDGKDSLEKLTNLRRAQLGYMI